MPIATLARQVLLNHIGVIKLNRQSSASATMALALATMKNVCKYRNGSGIGYLRMPSQSMMINASSPIGPIAFLSKP